MRTLLGLAVAFSLFGSGSPISAQVATNPIDALNNPKTHAWNLFSVVNHPAKDPNTARGEPDLEKKIGEPGLTVWETWKLARTEVFLEDGSKPPEWSDTSRDPSLRPMGPKLFDLPKPAVLRGLQLGMSPTELMELGPSSMRLFADIPEGLFGDGGGETRMNRSTFDFIRKNELYNIEGLEQLYENIVSGKCPPLSFPVDSIEVKAMWTPVGEGDKKERFHLSAGPDAKEYKLVSLHILTKDVPNWFWASFRQIDGPVPQLVSVGRNEQPASLKGTKWEFYELSGTQGEFVDALGRPTYLSDPHVEFGFEVSSCITCHALATIGRRGPPVDGKAPRPAQIAFFNTDNVRLNQNAENLPIIAPAGVPNPNWFVEPLARGAGQHQDFVQLDFLYSMPFRAKRKGAEPENNECPSK